jgi:hypothetical protein
MHECNAHFCVLSISSLTSWDVTHTMFAIIFQNKEYHDGKYRGAPGCYTHPKIKKKLKHYFSILKKSKIIHRSSYHLNTYSCKFLKNNTMVCDLHKKENLKLYYTANSVRPLSGGATNLARSGSRHTWIQNFFIVHMCIVYKLVNFV